MQSLSGKSQDALRVLQKSASLGYGDSLYSLNAIFRDGKYNFEKDPQRAACYDRLWEELKEDKTKKFPNLNKICPLPPMPMP
jgi:uncharacterized protein